MPRTTNTSGRMDNPKSTPTMVWGHSSTGTRPLWGQNWETRQKRSHTGPSPSRKSKQPHHPNLYLTSFVSCKRPGAQLFYVNFEQLNETHWRHARHAYASEKRARHVIQGLLHFPMGEGVHEFTTSTHGCWGMQQKGKAGSSQPRLLPFFKASIRKKKHSKITSHQNIFPHPPPAQVGTEPKAPCPLPRLPSEPSSCSRHLLPVSPSPRVQKVEREIKTQVNTH